MRVWRSIGKSLQQFALPLFLLGLGCLVVVPATIEGLLRQPALSATADRPSTSSKLTAWDVFSPSGGDSIGWLEVTYPESTKLNEEPGISVRYVAREGEWRRSAPSGEGSVGSQALTQMSVHVQAANLTVAPEPRQYNFDLERIGTTGSDGHSWTVTPQKEGSYRLLLNFDVQPDSYTTRIRVNENVVPTSDGALQLPVQVNTIYNVPQAWVDLGTNSAYVLGFLLTLPLLTKIFERYSDRKKRTPRKPVR